MTDPGATAMADQLQAAVKDRAKALVAEMLVSAGVRRKPNEDTQIMIEMGINAGSVLTMQVLTEMGLLRKAGDA